MKYYFVGDTHFDHSNIIRFCNRPFDNVEKMNVALINNWNAVVSPEDMVFHVGDFCMSNNVQRWEYFINALNGKIHLIRGNHDSCKVLQKVGHFFEWVKDYHKLYIQDIDHPRRRQDIILMHYAMRVWDKAHHGSWNLFGHSHGSLSDDQNAKAIDVGVDCHNYTPISYEQIKKIMSKKISKPVDKHKVN